MPALKYELVAGDTRTVLSATVHRIRALRPITAHRVRAGDLGGYVESERNLSQDGDAWISGDAMAVQRSRLEGAALATDEVLLSGFAILRDNARMSRFSRADGHAIIGGQARLTNAASAHDTVTISADITIGDAFAMTGNSAYVAACDAPKSLGQLNPDHPEFDGHLTEALNIDPALHRVFAALGVRAAPHRQAVVTALNRTPDGRNALTALVRAAGGTFHPDAYLALDSRELAAQRLCRVLRLVQRGKISNTRYLTGIGASPVHDPTTGNPSFPAILKAVRGANSTPLYQGIILTDHTPAYAITPLPATIDILPTAHSSALDAENAARARLIELFEEPDQADLTPLRPSGIATDLTDLPILIDCLQTSALTRCVLLRPGTHAAPAFMELHADTDFGTDFDFQDLTSEKERHWQPSQIAAAANPALLAIKLPTPSRDLFEAIKHATTNKPTEGNIIMKRDMDLIRSILMEIETDQQINGHFVLSDADIMSNLNAERPAVQYHLRLLMDAGYIEGKDLLADTNKIQVGDGASIFRESGSSITISRLTWEGHEFIDSVRDNNVWAKTKGYLKDVGGVGIDVLKDVAKAVVKDQIKQVTGLSMG